MKLNRTATRLGLAAAVVGGSLTAGCAGRTVIVDRRSPEVQTREVIVVESPPADREEIAPPSRPGYAWIPGHYRYNGRSYEWVGGRWEQAPRQEARWTPGRWNRSDRGYVWIEGRWD